MESASKQDVDRLHAADDHLAHASKEVEKALDSNEFRHQERINQATEYFRQVEKEVEDADAAVRKKIEPLAPGESA